MSEVMKLICPTLQMRNSHGQKPNRPREQLVVMADDFDRVTAERDAALGRELQSRNDLAKSLADHFRKNSEISALGEASKKLVFCARTSGGTAGPDQGLMDACAGVEGVITLGGIARAMNEFERLTAECDDLASRLEEALVESLANQNEREVVCVNYEALQQRLTAADDRADVLEAASVKQAALLDELGIPIDEVDDLFGETLKNAKRYEYLRSVMAVENFPAPHPAWSEPSEAESKRIDDLCDAALKPAESPRNQCDGCQAGIPVVNGAHRMGKPGGYPDTMSCTAKLYKP